MTEDSTMGTVRTGSHILTHDSNLVDEYKRASLSRQKGMYSNILDLMQRHHEKVGKGDWCFSENMYEVLTSTSVEILSFKFKDKETASYSMELFRVYQEYNLQIIQSVIHSDWDNISESSRSEINLSMYKAFAALDPVLELYKRYSWAKSSPYDNNNNLNQEYNSTLENFNNGIKLAQSLTLKFFPTGEKLLETFFRLKVNFHSELRQTTEEIVKNLGENEKINTETKKIVKEGIIQKEAKRFNKTANSHKWRAILSIVGAFVFAALAFVWVHSIPMMESSKDCVSIATEDAMYAISREFLCRFFNLNIQSFVFASGLFATMIYACLRSYSANSQNEVSNRQRFNALNSYELLYNVADNKEDKNFIMQKAVECAYSHQPTGFVKQQKDNENPQQTFNIIPNLERVARTATDTTSGRSGAE